MNILVVDDDVVDRETLKRALRGYTEIEQITEAKSFAQGLEEVNKKHYDMLVVDYYLPDKNGIELVIELRSKPNLGNTAVVMVSNSDDEDLAVECLQAGAQDFIRKSEITAQKLKRAFIQAQKRFELEKKLYDSFCQVRELAEKDSLTGLSNRYHFEKALKLSLANNKRSQDVIALLLHCYCLISTISKTSMILTGTKQAIRCCKAWQTVLLNVYVETRCSLALEGMNLPFLSPG